MNCYFRKISFGLSLFLPFLLFAQTDISQAQTKFEVFFNISNALSKATGNLTTATSLRTDPNALGFKIVPSSSKLPVIRFGTNFKVSKSENIQLNRTSQESLWIANVGIEFRKNISPKFQYFYGVDFQYFSQQTNVNNVFNTGGPNIFLSSDISSTEKGPGVAPLLGLRWNIVPRVALYTEGFIGFFFLEEIRTVSSNGTETSRSALNQLFFNPIMPGAIVLNITL